MATITITQNLSKPGSPTVIEVDGVKGGSCKDLTASLEQNLGISEGAVELKPEFYEAEREGEREAE